MIFVNTCAQQTRMLEFDPNGNYVREIGKDLFGHILCHGVRVDAQDNIWVIDEGANMIIKFNPAGRVTMVIGRRPEYPVSGLVLQPGANDPAPPYILNRPTDVAFDKAGNIFVADGYVNSRVIKYDKNGRFVKQAGTRGSGPGQLTLLHAIAVGCSGRCLRGQPQRPAHRRVRQRPELQDRVRPRRRALVPVHRPGPRPYLCTSNSNPDSQNTPLHEVTGQIFKMELDGKVVGKFGVPGKEQGQFSTVHGIDCSVENEILTTEITQWRMQKFILQPTASTRGQVHDITHASQPQASRPRCSSSPARWSPSRRKSRSIPPVIS